MKKMMYRVRYWDTDGKKMQEALFTSKACAEMFVADCFDRGITASLNKYLWEVEIEN